MELTIKMQVARLLQTRDSPNKSFILRRGSFEEEPGSQMENGQACSCFNGTQDDGNYSAPVPVIGLYIAGATLVCLLLIVGDLVNAFRSRMLWVPCRFFPINSFTLTVVGVVTKIPVDLTTPMPDGQDQLAKLCGTVLLFIFMVLFLPSFGNMKASERLPNLASLTLIVITVIVNICLQIGTGLIFKFVPEHVVIFVLMILTLCMMWSSNIDVDIWFDCMIGDYKRLLKDSQSTGDGTIDFEIKSSLTCQLNVPELLRCKYAHYPTMGILSATCFIISSEATFRAAFNEKASTFFGQSVSDYKWSMWVLVGTQIITLVVGSVSISFKSLFLASQMKPFVFPAEYNNFFPYQQMRSFVPFFHSYYLPKILSRLCIPEIFQALRDLLSFLQFIINIGMEWTDQVVIFLVVQIGSILGIFKNRDIEKRERIGQCFSEALQLFPIEDESFNLFLLMQSVDYTELLIEKERVRNPQISHLIQLLSRYPRPITSFTQQLDPMEGIDEFLVSILLVRLTDVLLPSDRTTSLVRTFDEVFDILYFIVENPVKKPKGHDLMMRTAREFWMCRKISNHHFERVVVKTVKKWGKKLNYDAGLVLRTLATEGTIISEAVACIVNLLNIQENEPSDVLRGRIEELFVCLLHRFLNRLPNIIFKYIVESPNQDFLDRAVMCLKFLCRLNLIGANVRWSETTGVPWQVNTVAALKLRHIIGVAGDELGSQTETLPDDYSSIIVYAIASCIAALINASHLTMGVPGEEQGNQTISDGYNFEIIARIASRIAGLIIASPPTTGVTGEEQGSQTLITSETLTDNYDRKLVRVAAGIAALILDSRLTIGVAGEEQGSQTFVTRETLTDDYNRQIVARIAAGIAAGIAASPPTVGVSSEEQGSQTFITVDTSTDGYRRKIDARVYARVAALIIALPPTIGVAGEEQGSQTFITRETLTAEKLLHVLLVALLSNIYSNGVAGEGQGSQTSIANDGAVQNSPV